MRKKILEFIRKHRMISPGDVVCVGFSGGADSVCLLLWLRELSEELSFQLQAVHVNHGLRGRESDEDQAFAEEFCRERGIPLFVYEYQVAQMAREGRMGLEEAGRAARRRAYEECMEKNGATRIALAHHQNDLAETVLFHLARGSSLKGLSAIRPVSGAVIRPLLCVTREEIENDLKRRGVGWRTDSSNLKDDYTRNVIRHEIIPCLEKNINRGAVRHMAEAADDLEAADRFLRREAEKRRLELTENVGENGQDRWLLKEEITEEPEILQGYLILGCLETLAGVRKNLTREHVSMVRSLMNRQSGRKIMLPYGIEGRRTYRGVVLERAEAAERQRQKSGFPEIPVTGNGVYQAGKYHVACEIFAENAEKIPEKAYTKWLDYDRIKAGLVLRTRRQGDYLVINASGGRKKLKDYMIDCKIPVEERDSILLLASGHEVFWVVGYRIGESCKVSENTSHILRIEVTGGKLHE